MEGKEIRSNTTPRSTTKTPESGAGRSKKEWDDKNLISLAVLNNSFADFQHPLIARCATAAAEAWAELNTVFEFYDIPMQMNLRDALHTLKMNTSDVLLEEAHLKEEELTTQSVIASVLLEEAQLKEKELTDGMAALYAAKRRRWTPKMIHPRNSTEAGSLSRQEPPAKPSSPRQKMKCFYCKKRSHLANECRKKKQDNSSAHSPADDQQRLYVTTLSSVGMDLA
ncbi:hypothetical protein AXG93_2121s1040 [Marchantia polymorpha subsp. ruderalis]|uniref:CCHC-type domain-containing protein n=1 Tax=Marchantia polymorpha subsp. ruderalis TaxID=1480154 RepID=A0A176WCS2_MARPO|nr:hypothetical protein AXG93_2121s1040 [Marchantia polymorpha subsp. ruderalis]